MRFLPLTISLLLIAVGIVFRLMPHAWNVTPVTAIAIVAGAALSRRVAWSLPVLVMIVSDLIIGLHPLVLFTWGSFAVIALCSQRVLRRHVTPLRVIGMSLGASLFYFIVTNAAYWVFSPMYAKTLSGLGEAYVLALPFFRNMALGDLVFTGVAVGAYALWQRRGIPLHARSQALPISAERRP